MRPSEATALLCSRTNAQDARKAWLDAMAAHLDRRGPIEAVTRARMHMDACDADLQALTAEIAEARMVPRAVAVVIPISSRR
jgi:hypothetical protein